MFKRFQDQPAPAEEENENESFYETSDSSSSEEEEIETAQLKTSEKQSLEKEKTLVLCSRGSTSRFRHLMKDLMMLLPHAKQESKFDSKKETGLVNELMELNNCTSCLYFEARKHQDLYLWMAKAVTGPSLRFLIQNIHTLDELRMQGNCLKGSRPVLSFDSSFDESPHFALVKECLKQIFHTPQGHRKSKPFVDRVMSFSIADNKIWVRNFQIADKLVGDETEMSLVEIGPRFVMTLQRIMDGCFSGPVLYENPDFVSPNVVRSEARKEQAMKSRQRIIEQPYKEKKIEEKNLPKDELSTIFE
ncbi:Brix-domain-containing protein [Rozella allomycis CSF55]|uniref:Brix-domain-containing protein n=1 Tax=Rozella allomycis (strain CSF55) TaxID=988480 RepID=A0A075ARY8_ROZAC|nr:Ribosome biogenesis protein BRX1 domain-containing protein [Rozella allomycis CSF55]RKP21740.1 Brix-domain-containing protein [Rozella allomycis CSF55]|eukprot:EPZ31308.1 Ribosome biogenesis protein BRX1 domain-containing protein [Rozella allomycis CSF55]